MNYILSIKGAEEKMESVLTELGSTGVLGPVQCRLRPSYPVCQVEEVAF